MKRWPQGMLGWAGWMAIAAMLGLLVVSGSWPWSGEHLVGREAGKPRADVWSQLRQGGYVLLLRHTEAPGTGDPAGFRLGDCATQRNLSVAGRSQARQIGQVFREQQIPVSRVLSSQWCRCLETARLLDLGPVEPLPALNSFFQQPTLAQAQTEKLRQFITKTAPNDTVLVLVTHQVNITALTDIFPKQGELIVLKVESSKDIQVITRISL